MDSVVAITGKDFVLIAADQYSTYSIFRLKDDEDKIMEIDGDKLLGASGPQGDRHQFGEYIRKNLHLHRLRTGIALSTAAAATFTRNEIAYHLRSNPFEVNILLAGYNVKTGPELYWMDYLGSSVAVDKAAHGYASYFVAAILDRYWKPDMTQEEAMDVLKLCAEELKKRFLLSQCAFATKIVDKEGIHFQRLEV